MVERLLFLERAALRRRRLGDAARVLPVLATLAVLVPVWWVPARVSFAAGTIWVFGLWAGLIAVTALLHRALARHDRDEAGAAKVPPDAL